MKKFLLVLCALLMAAPVFAQKNPAIVGWIIDDSTETNVFNIGVTHDEDTSKPFSIFRMPETGLTIIFYQNTTTADTGECVAILEMTAFTNPTLFSSDSTDAVWYYVDSLQFGLAGNSIATATGRSAWAWNPTLIGSGYEARIRIIRRGGHVARTVALARSRLD